MMEFLDKIYGYEHFGIILFAVIAILVVLFLIILFFGKKDEKKREIERTQKLEAQNVAEGFATVNPEPVQLNVEAPTFASVENIMEQAPIIDPVVETTPVMNTEVVTPTIEPIVESPVIESTPVAPILEPTVEPTLVTPVEPVVAPIIEPVIQPEVNVEPISVPTPEPVVEPVVNESVEEIKIPNFNFDELAASIANELNSLENKPAEPVTPVAPTIEPTPVVPVEPVAAPITPINEVVKPAPTPGPVTFSSVYINKPAEPVKEVQVVEPPVAPVTPVTPTPVQNPNIELPKPAEMPILNKEVNEPVVNTEPTAIPDFSQFEGESYDIK